MGEWVTEFFTRIAFVGAVVVVNSYYPMSKYSDDGLARRLI